jgi:hypothetical protein
MAPNLKSDGNTLKLLMQRGSQQHLRTIMNEPESKLIESALSGNITKDGITLELCIYRLENTDWSLEVVNSNGTSLVWDDLFSSDHAAHDEFNKTIAEYGMAAFDDDENVIQPSKNDS